MKSLIMCTPINQACKTSSYFPDSGFYESVWSRYFGERVVRACAAMWSLPSQTWLALPSHLPSRLDRFCCKLDGLCHVYFAFRCKSIWMKI